VIEHFGEAIGGEGAFEDADRLTVCKGQAFVDMNRIALVQLQGLCLAQIGGACFDRERLFGGQAAAKRMLAQQPENGRLGTILLTGASAGVKGFAHSAPFAMGKFAQRGLAQSMARELHPKGIHVAWVNIDGGIRNASRPERVESADNPDSMLDPDAIAREYMHLIQQDRSAWSDELVLRPWVERF
jgi:NAD(P)-dependent dehydrogenase (short-subunit alcohol dehydrogenase family)